MKNQTYSVGDVAKQTGVSLKQLRSWGGKYIQEPERVVCGERAYRRYTQDQINLIVKIKEYQDQGFTLKTAAQKAGEEISKQELKKE